MSSSGDSHNPKPSVAICSHAQPERGRLYCWICGLPLWWRRPTPEGGQHHG